VDGFSLLLITFSGSNMVCNTAAADDGDDELEDSELNRGPITHHQTGTGTRLSLILVPKHIVVLMLIMITAVTDITTLGSTSWRFSCA
jgi:hypothetical protein